MQIKQLTLMIEDVLL